MLLTVVDAAFIQVVAVADVDVEAEPVADQQLLMRMYCDCWWCL